MQSTTRTMPSSLLALLAVPLLLLLLVASSDVVAFSTTTTNGPGRISSSSPLPSTSVRRTLFCPNRLPLSAAGRSSIVLPATASSSDDAASSSKQATVELEASQTREKPALETDDVTFVKSLYAACSGDVKLMEDEIAANLENMHPRLVVALQLAAEEGTWKGEKEEDMEDAEEFSKQMVAVGHALKSVLDVRLRSGRELLAQLLDSGELRKMDGAIGKAAKDGKLDMSFFSVLGMNMRDATFHNQQQGEGEGGDDINVVSLEPTLAQGEGQEEVSGPEGEPNASASRLQILQHIYTRCQEELEKNVPPGVGLLNKLLRTEIPSIRSNQLQYYLGPQATTITSPDGKTIDLGGTAKPLVSHDEFVEALANAVERIRTIEGAGGTDRLSAMNLLESVRRVAVEARAVLAESYGEDSDAVREFQDDLQPVFRPPSSS